MIPNQIFIMTSNTNYLQRVLTNIPSIIYPGQTNMETSPEDPLYTGFAEPHLFTR